MKRLILAGMGLCTAIAFSPVANADPDPAPPPVPAVAGPEVSPAPKPMSPEDQFLTSPDAPLTTDGDVLSEDIYIVL